MYPAPQPQVSRGNAGAEFAEERRESNRGSKLVKNQLFRFEVKIIETERSVKRLQKKRILGHGRCERSRR